MSFLTAAVQSARGIQPTLRLDFTKEGPLDPRITFARSGVATCVNNAGLIETVGDNVPRFDHDPITLKLKGLLFEEGRTNAHLGSASMNGYFFTSPGTGDQTSSNYGLFADGQMTMKRIQTGGAYRTLRRVSSETGIDQTGSQYCISYFYRVRSGSIYTVAARAGTGASPTDLGPHGPEGLRRAYVVINSGTNASAFIDIGFTNNADIDIGGIQVEKGATFPTSYIPTAGAAVTRGHVYMEINGANFSSWYNPNEGTFLCEFTKTNGSSSRVLTFNSSTTHVILGANFSPDGYGLSSMGAGLYGTGLGITRPSGQYCKVATAYRSDGNFSSVDGGGAIPTGIDNFHGTTSQLKFGPLQGTNYFNGYIRKVTYFPKALSALQLQNLTAV
ncbi:phage head spike fiber domain-containing protein [Persicitalea jodogahamensis]|uniref:Uncharacterized protein n=1 Tax=Persicitalea jodogahamensis TaxID=402147 RepID=A0A8J3D2Y4_9BACT|nr:hypothetical protein [Persicitalea jodogahamensis]GHB63984.1 hypothetical protein GCM10007390_17320 [Persicitalea jodogahamensis]